jgi:L-threonylcarbamoyladenylate synthase
MIDTSQLDIIQKAVSVLTQGGILIYPTDTAFGIGCRMDDKSAVKRLFTIRKRSVFKAVPVLVSSERMALAYFDHPSDIVRHFMHLYWPGALTIVSACHKKLVYSPIRGGTDSIGMRKPDYPVLLDIISSLGVPILGPSANFSGERTPYVQNDLNPELIKLVDMVMPGQSHMGNVSTVVDCTTKPYTIIRQGAVHIE